MTMKKQQQFESSISILDHTEISQMLDDTTFVLNEAIDNLNYSDVKCALTKAFRGVLSKRQLAVLDYRFGLSNNEPMTLKAVGKKFSVSAERIRAIESQALRNLRHPKSIRLLENCLLLSWSDPLNICHPLYPKFLERKVGYLGLLVQNQ